MHSFPLLYLDVASNVTKFFFYLANGLKVSRTVESISSQHQQLYEILSDVSVFVRVFVCVHETDMLDEMCAYVCTHVWMYVCVYIYVYVRIRIRMRVCVNDKACFNTCDSHGV